MLAIRSLLSVAAGRTGAGGWQFRWGVLHRLDGKSFPASDG
jgi:hypothetical protein